MFSLKSIRDIEEKMGEYSLSEEVFAVIAMLTSKVGGNTLLLSKGKVNKESLNGLLNKLTNDTYNQIAAKVLSSVPTSDTIDTIIKVANGNMFYSKVYARLCHQIIEKNDGLRVHLLEKCTSHVDGIANIGERGLTLFVTNLALNGCVPMELCVDMANRIQTKIEEHKDDDEEVVSTYIDHLTLILTQTKALTETCALEARVRTVSETDTKKHKGISLKNVFKCMDILDHFK
jgi:hypothetical protein